LRRRAPLPPRRARRTRARCPATRRPRAPPLFPDNPPCAAQAIQLINHDGEVNRARYMPQNPFMLATKTVRRARARQRGAAQQLLCSPRGGARAARCRAAR
jgi:hypothetical protein